MRFWKCFNSTLYTTSTDHKKRHLHGATVSMAGRLNSWVCSPWSLFAALPVRGSIPRSWAARHLLGLTESHCCPVVTVHITDNGFGSKVAKASKIALTHPIQYINV